MGNIPTVLCVCHGECLRRPVILRPDVLEERHEHLPIYVIITVVCENRRNASGWFIPDETGRNKTRARLLPLFPFSFFFLFLFCPSTHRIVVCLIASAPILPRVRLLSPLFNSLISNRENGGNYQWYNLQLTFFQPKFPQFCCWTELKSYLLT